MFNKIAIINNKIRLMRHEVEWEEQSKINFDPEKNEQLVKRSEMVIDASTLISRLTERGITYQVKPIEIGEELEQFDNTEWTSGRDEAILYINGMGKYNPSLIKIKELKEKLSSMDYKTSKYADGDYTDSEWSEITAERKALRSQLRTLETEMQG